MKKIYFPMIFKMMIKQKNIYAGANKITSKNKVIQSYLSKTLSVVVIGIIMNVVNIMKIQ
jgi:hypothetical protein